MTNDNAALVEWLNEKKAQVGAALRNLSGLPIVVMQSDTEPSKSAMWMDNGFVGCGQVAISTGEFPDCQTQSVAALANVAASLDFDAIITALKPDGDAGDQCDQCGCNFQTVYRVPNDIWAQIAPKPDALGEHIEHQCGGLLCLPCADRAARERGIELCFEGSVGWPDGDAVERIVTRYFGCPIDAFDSVKRELVPIEDAVRLGLPAIRPDTEAERLLRRLLPYVNAAHAGIDTSEEREALRREIDTYLTTKGGGK